MKDAASFLADWLTDSLLERNSDVIRMGERLSALNEGASLRDRAGAPSGLSHSSVSQAKPLIPSAGRDL